MTKLEASCFIQAQIMADRAELVHALPAMKTLLELRIEAGEIALNAINESSMRDIQTVTLDEFHKEEV